MGAKGANTTGVLGKDEGKVELLLLLKSITNVDATVAGDQLDTSLQVGPFDEIANRAWIEHVALGGPDIPVGG